MQQFKYKISVISPVFNVEQYLDESIVSIIDQTLGFEENIQLILINDGSTDNSEEICLKYKEMFPNNIIYVKQENKGVSSARNHGMDFIEGKYVSFLDSDDKWKSNAFLKIYDFFETHYDEIDLVAGRMRFFEATKDFHPLDYKFNRNKIVNILKDYDQIQLHITSSVIKSEIAKKYKFDTQIKYGEDAKFVNEILLNNPSYGLMRNALHYYRKRFNQSSAIQNKEKDIAWYTVTIDEYYKKIFDLSTIKYGCIIRYAQFLIMYDLKWRFKSKIPPPMDKHDRETYDTKIYDLLNQIDDAIICQQHRIHAEHKVFLLSKKYNMDIANQLIISLHKRGRKILDGIFYKENFITVIQNPAVLKINILQVYNEGLHIEGQISTIFNDTDYEIYCETDNRKLKLNLTKNHLGDVFFGGECIKSNKSFALKIPVQQLSKLKFVLKYKKFKEYKLDINYTQTSKLSNIAKSYYISNGYLFYAENMELIKEKNNIFKHILFELKLIKQLFHRKKFKIIIYRLAYYACKLFKRKEIWVISDRPNAADDNGYHLFKYICNQKNNNIKPYFVISKKSQDYEKLRKIGRVLNFDFYYYKIIFLMADKIISSQADDWVLNAFGKNNRYYRDLYNYKFIFLQHGIIKDDLSVWLHKFNKNIAMFVTAAENEYKSILEGKYGYDEKVVKLTGMPRYDSLIDEKKKQIVIIPTWRKGYAGRSVNGVRGYNSRFKYSEYFKFYNTLINDTKLLSAITKKGYQGIFVIHPAIMAQYDDFDFNNVFQKNSKIPDYQTLFKQSSLMITDYSSVAMDFAYLYKPIIYTQFDKNEFFKQHVYVEGYFDYERDGFGPVVYDYKSTVDEIIKSIENDCIIEDEYIERIDQFYKYHDKDNCKRVYDEILKLDI